MAQTVADTLKAKLTGSEAVQIIARPTANPAAYDAYLRGLAWDNRTDSVLSNVSKAITAFEEAVRLDPGFAIAWGRLSREHARAYLGPATSSAHRLAASEALQHAVSLAPAAAETLKAQAVSRYWLERDYDGAKELFERIRQQWPNDSSATEWLAGIARRQGRWRESAALFDQAIELNPRDVSLLDDAISVALAMRDVRTAQRLLDRVFDMTPDDPGALDGQVLLFQETGEIDRAQKILAQARIAQGDVKLAIDFTYNATLNRTYEPAIALLTSQLEKPEALGPALGYFQVKLADLQRHSGNAVAAKRSYEQARATIETSLRAEPNNPYHVNCLALAEAGLGNEAAALEQARRAISLLPASKDAYVGPVWEENLARLQARFGDKDAAIAALERLLGISYGWPPQTPALLQLDPDWDNLRSDPRF